MSLLHLLLTHQETLQQLTSGTPKPVTQNDLYLARSLRKDNTHDVEYECVDNNHNVDCESEDSPHDDSHD
eukprot:6468978-Amphidinium_carterae.1